MKNLFALLVLAFCATSLAADVSGPRIQFESTAFDFGRLKQGETAKHEFVFTNTGNAMLEILDVKPGCGCTTAGTWDKLIEPGKTGRIPLAFNSTGFGGTISKSALVTCNDAAKTNLVLSISGTVWKPIDITPAMAMFQVDPEHQTNQTKILKIVSNLEESITISELTSSNPSFKPELKTVKEGKEFELHVTAVPPFSQSTTFGPITMKTSSAKSPNLNVTAYATMQLKVVTMPQQLNLPAPPLANAITSTVSIYYRGTNSLKLTEASVNFPGAEVSIQETRPGQVFSVQTRFPAGTEIKPGTGVQLTVKTDYEKQPVLTVPIFQSSSSARVSPKASLRRITPGTNAVQQAGFGKVTPVPVRPGSGE